MNWRTRSARTGMLLLGALLAAAAAQAQQKCQAGEVEVSREIIPGPKYDTYVLHCHGIGELPPGELRDLKPAAIAALSPEDRQRLVFLRLLHDDQAQELPLDAPRKNAPGERSTYAYFQVIAQFHVEESERYQAKVSDTYCNIYASDVMSAMGADLPRVPNGQGGDRPRLVNEIADWLRSDANRAQASPWRRVDARMAEEMAQSGHPSLVLVRGSPHGHIAVIRPGSVGDARGAAISHAGRWVLDANHADIAFGDPTARKVQYWVHD